MGISMKEFGNLPEHEGRAFGASSEERKKIVVYLAENGACTPAEVGEGTEIEQSVAKKRLDVMRRDELVTWKDKDDEVFYGLTEKGMKRLKKSKE